MIQVTLYLLDVCLCMGMNRPLAAAAADADCFCCRQLSPGEKRTTFEQLLPDICCLGSASWVEYVVLFLACCTAPAQGILSLLLSLSLSATVTAVAGGLESMCANALIVGQTKGRVLPTFFVLAAALIITGCIHALPRPILAVAQDGGRSSHHDGVAVS
jgi:hypothetical protein